MFLAHSFVESSERKNVYDGVAVADGQGKAVVQLPPWFETLNTDLRYQLTPIGEPAPNLHVAEEVSNGRFKVAGAPAGLRFSWQITGVRQDEWAKSHPLLVEDLKQGPERGRYLNPELYGRPREEGIERIRHPLGPRPERPSPSTGRD